MKPLRILQVVPNMHAAGLETLIMNLYRNIDRTKIQFDFLVHYTERCFYDDEIEALGGHIYRLSFREDGNFAKYIKDLKKFFSTHHYMIVHGHMASTACFYLKYAKKYNVPVRILHSHNTSTEKNIKGKIKKQLLKISTLYANEYFACGKDAGQFLYGNRNFEIIHNAIDLNKFKYDEEIRKIARKKYNLHNDFVIGHIGRFNSQKNHRFIIDLFEKFHYNHSNSKLVLIGEGELENEIKQVVKDKKMNDCVLFLGILKDTNLIYNMIDVFVLPSLFEGLPVVGIEAQAAKCDIIMSDKITREVSVTNYVKYLPIDTSDSIDKWVNEVENIFMCKKEKKGNVFEQLTKSGFNASEEAKRLQEIYLKLLVEKEDEKC